MELSAHEPLNRRLRLSFFLDLIALEHLCHAESSIRLETANAFTLELRVQREHRGPQLHHPPGTCLHRDRGSVSNVRRLEPGKNVRWEITIQPSSNAGVTIVLPITMDCTAQGAICTSDGRKLSSRVELTISGPSE